MNNNTLRVASRRLRDAASGQGVATDICVGAIAQLVGSVVFTPVDVIKERMQVGGGDRVLGSTWCVVLSCVRTECMWCPGSISGKDGRPWDQTGPDLILCA